MVAATVVALLVEAEGEGVGARDGEGEGDGIGLGITAVVDGERGGTTGEGDGEAEGEGEGEGCISFPAPCQGSAAQAVNAASEISSVSHTAGSHELQMAWQVIRKLCFQHHTSCNTTHLG